MKTNGIPAVVRDMTLLGLGTGMLAYMTYTQQANALLIFAALAILGIPTGVAAAQLFRGKPETQVIPGSSSSSASSSSSQP